MLYRDLKPGDTLINAWSNRFIIVIGVGSFDDQWITVHFVRYWGDEIEIYDCDYLSTTEVTNYEVIRNAFQESETG